MKKIALSPTTLTQVKDSAHLGLRRTITVAVSKKNDMKRLSKGKSR